MKVTCKNCGWSLAGISKAQAHDMARFEGCTECGGNLQISGGVA